MNSASLSFVSLLIFKVILLYVLNIEIVIGNLARYFSYDHCNIIVARNDYVPRSFGGISSEIVSE